MQTLLIKKVHPDAQLPEYASDGAACFDLRAVDIDQDGKNHGIILPFSAKTFRTGLAFEIPKGYAMMIYSRSGQGFGPHGARLSNCVGVIDSDYRGEVKVKLRVDDIGGEANGPYTVKNGDRIAQAMLVPVPLVQFVEVSELSETARGQDGFGSTGSK